MLARQVHTASALSLNMHSDVFRWPVIEAQVEHWNFSGEPSWKYLSSLKLTVRTWKWMVGICVSFWNGLFSEAMLGSGRVMDSIRASHPIWKKTWISNQLYHLDFLELSHQSLRHVPWVNLRIEIIYLLEKHGHQLEFLRSRCLLRLSLLESFHRIWLFEVVNLLL